MTETIEEQRRVEGFGDPQYDCSPEELFLRHAINLWLQGLRNVGLVQLRQTQDWQGNILHVEFRPAELARALLQLKESSIEDRRQ